MTVAARLQVLPLKRTEPALVVLGEGEWRPALPSYVQGTLAFDPDRTPDDVFGPQASATADLPDPAEWARTVVRLCLEVADGVRPAGQLGRWVSPDVRAALTRRGVLARRRRQRQRHPVRVGSLLTCAPVDGVVEVSAVVTHNTRVRALALRLVGQDGRWVVTVLTVG